MDFASVDNYKPAELNGTFRYPIKNNFRQLRISGMINLQNFIFDLEDNAQITGWVANSVGLDISNNVALETFQTIAAPSLTKCRIKRAIFSNNDSLEIMDLSEYLFFTESPADLTPNIDVSGSSILTTITINGCEKYDHYGFWGH